MTKYKEYLEDDFVIWNSALGINAFATIGEIDTKNKQAWLDDPYDMVGPFSVKELIENGQISFAACVVMTKEKWVKDQAFLQEQSFHDQRKAQKEFAEDVRRHREKRANYHNNLESSNEETHRKLLCLPLVGCLEVAQIKTAYRKIVKTAHPDVGGSHEKFIKITEARDYLLQK